MKKIITQQTKLSKSNNNSISTKTTIPVQILQILNLQQGDRIEWNALLDKNNKIHVTINKKEE